MTASQDTEITLGTGKMLAIFFGLVILCAVFFGMGFSLGKNSVKPAEIAQIPAPATNTSARPNAVKPASATGDMTFYKSVADKNANASLEAPDTGNSAPTPQETKTPEDSAPPAIGPGYLVQVAAVSKQEDADALVDALKKKQYPAFAATNAPTDKLIHVQVGPYSDVKEAEAMKTKLVSDGYNPILKK
jgi:cell division septation protein DedD